MENMDTFVIRGNATIDCNNRWTQRFRNIRSVLISGLTFASCEEDVYIDDVDQLVIENSTFQQRLRIDDVKISEIRNTSFLSGTQILYVKDTSVLIQGCSFENNMMGLLAEHSNVTIDRSVFQRNFSPRRYRTFSVPYYNVHQGGAIYMIHQRYRNHGSMTLAISNSEFRDNSVVSSGGAIFITDGNVTISNSAFVNNSATSGGGAIYASNRILNDAVEMHITHSEFRDNSVVSRVTGGGAISINDENITISNSVFMNNSATSDGGAIYASNLVKNDAVEMHITQSSFINNRADTSGGAIALSDSIQINQCSFVNNTAKRGGGAILTIRDNSSVSVSESAFNLNSASYCGVFQISGVSHNVKLTKSIFAQNRARGDSDFERVLNGRGERDDIAGIMCVRNASISVLKSEFSQNSATGYGGVLYVDDSKVNIRESAFYDNSAGMDGGVTYTELYQVQFRISYCLFTNNRAGGQGGVLAVRRSGSYVGTERSTFGNNTANDQGGVFFILGGSLRNKETNFYGNEAKSGGVITACHSEVAPFDDLVATTDDVHPVCSHYDGEVDGFNITAPPDADDMVTTTLSPMDMTTPTPAVDTTISTVTTTISTESDAISTTTIRSPIPDTTTSPLNVYFVLKGSVYLNNSAISVGEVGEGEDALICRTNNRECCATPPNRAGEFYYPKGDVVPIRSRAGDFYRNRGEGEIRLNLIAGSTAVTGRFSCSIPDANGAIQVVHIYLF